MSRQRRQFTSEFKAEAVALVRRTGQSANQVAKELGATLGYLSPVEFEQRASLVEEGVH